MSVFNDAVKVERGTAYDLGCEGMITILDGAVPAMQRESIELTRLYNQAHNIEEGALSGLTVVADLIGSHDSSVSELDENGVGWLINHLVSNLRAAHSVRYTARRELIRRGLDELGDPLRNFVGAPAVLGVQS